MVATGSVQRVPTVSLLLVELTAVVNAAVLSIAALGLVGVPVEDALVMGAEDVVHHVGGVESASLVCCQPTFTQRFGESSIRFGIGPGDRHCGIGCGIGPGGRCRCGVRGTCCVRCARGCSRDQPTSRRGGARGADLCGG